MRNMRRLVGLSAFLISLSAVVGPQATAADEVGVMTVTGRPGLNTPVFTDPLVGFSTPGVPGSQQSAVMDQLSHAEVTPTEVAGPPKINAPVFNNPLGDQTQQRAVFDQLIRLIQATQPGSTTNPGEINVAMHEWKAVVGDKVIDVPGHDVALALAEAANSGVHVKVVLDGSTVSIEEQGLYEFLSFLLGNDRTQDSWVLRCPLDRGCIAPNPEGPEKGYMHNKFATFKNLMVNGTAYNAVFQSSSNMHAWYVRESFNDAYTLATSQTSVEDPVFNVFQKYQDYFRDLGAGLTDPDYYHVQEGGPYRVALFPKAADATDDPLVNSLNKVDPSCVYRDPQGHSIVATLYLALTHFRTNRIAIANKLLDLASRGCLIKIITGGIVDAKVQEQLKLTIWNGKPIVRPIVFRPCKIAVPNTTLTARPHTKTLIIDALYNGSTEPRVFTGSANYSSLPESDDVELQIVGRANRDLYAKWFFDLENACFPSLARTFV